MVIYYRLDSAVSLASGAVRLSVAPAALLERGFVREFLGDIIIDLGR